MHGRLPRFQAACPGRSVVPRTWRDCARLGVTFARFPLRLSWRQIPLQGQRLRPGAIANFLATRLPRLKAAAPFYGNASPLEDVPNIRAELLVVLADNDERVNATWPPYQAALDAAGVRYALLQPAGTQHGFHNDTTPRYDESAARNAWTRTLALFERTLRSQKASKSG